MPSHISSCPSQVQIKQYIRDFEATVKPEDRERKVREIIAALRNSELKNSRCLTQALAYYDRIRSQRNKKQ